MNLTSSDLSSIESKSETAGAQTLRRGLTVLRLLTRVGPSGLRMSEIGRRANLRKQTAIRLTKTLADEGFVVRDMTSGCYRLGPEAFAIGLAAEPSYALQRLAAPTLKALALESSDTVFFFVLHGYESICLSRNEGDFPIRNQLVKPGDRWPLGVGAGSCALLAAMANDEIEEVLRINKGVREERFPRCTDNEIQSMIKGARDCGYVVQPGLVLEDSWAVGVVIRDVNMRPVASISIAALASRLGPARSAALGNRLKGASAELLALQRSSSPASATSQPAAV